MDQDVPFERIGGYRVLRRLATGGTSDVLLARAEGPHGFERTVVLKLLLQQFRRDAPMEKMFAREAAAYARLSHPAIVKLYDFFSAEGQLVMVLEFIDGLPLNRFRAMLRKNGEQVDDRASIFIASRVFASLAAAHGARDPESGEFAPVIHRDVNPSNILIPWDGHVKLADFGIAKVAGITSDTQAGFIKGTYGYMAPEQVRGEPVTIRTDVYAASLLLWELLARRKAIQRGALPELEVLRAMAEPSLPSLDVLRPDLPQRLRDAIARGLEPSPDARSVTAEEMLMVLRESVTSNEGRNVLAETLVRVRQEADASRSGPPPAASADATSKVASQPAPPRTPRTESEASIDGPMRTALSTGQVPAVSATGAILGRVVPPPARGGLPKLPPPGIRPVATLALGLLREESLGSYSAVATGGRPVSEERTATRLGVAPAPPLPPRPPPIPDAAPARSVARSSPDAGDALPPALGGASAGDSLPPVLGGGSSAAATAHAPATLIGQPVISVDSVPPLFAVPPPPAAILAIGEEFASAPSTVPMPTPFPAQSPPTPPPPPPIAFMTPAPAPAVQTTPSQQPRSIAAMLASTIPMARPMTPAPPPPATVPPQPGRVLTPLPPLPVAVGPRKGGMYLAVAGIALLGSALVVGALIYSQRTTAAPAVATESASRPVTTAPPTTPTAAAIPPPTAAALPPATAVPVPPPIPTAAPVPPPAATAAPTPPATPSLPSADGEIVTPAKAGGHRVFVDGRYAGDSPGPIRVHCGPHSVKVGSSGVPHTVTVPCGGEISVSPH